jgi:hypothetical protein
VSLEYILIHKRARKTLTTNQLEKENKMFALILAVVFSGNVSEDRLPGVEISFSTIRPVIVHDSVNVTKLKGITFDDMNKIDVNKAKKNEKPNPDWVVISEVW